VPDEQGSPPCLNMHQGRSLGLSKGKAPEPLSAALRHHQKRSRRVVSHCLGNGTTLRWTRNGAEHARQAQGLLVQYFTAGYRVEGLTPTPTGVRRKEKKESPGPRFSHSHLAGSSNVGHPFIIRPPHPIQFFSPLESSHIFQVPHQVVRSCSPTPGSPLPSR
jgi:hypothetical protein